MMASHVDDPVQITITVSKSTPLYQKWTYLCIVSLGDTKVPLQDIRDVKKAAETDHSITKFNGADIVVTTNEAEGSIQLISVENGDMRFQNSLTKKTFMLRGFYDGAILPPQQVGAEEYYRINEKGFQELSFIPNFDGMVFSLTLDEKEVKFTIKDTTSDGNGYQLTSGDIKCVAPTDKDNPVLTLTMKEDGFLYANGVKLEVAKAYKEANNVEPTEALSLKSIAIGLTENSEVIKDKDNKLLVQSFTIVGQKRVFTSQPEITTVDYNTKEVNQSNWESQIKDGMQNSPTATALNGYFVNAGNTPVTILELDPSEPVDAFKKHLKFDKNGGAYIYLIPHELYKKNGFSDVILDYSKPESMVYFFTQINEDASFDPTSNTDPFNTVKGSKSLFAIYNHNPDPKNQKQLGAMLGAFGNPSHNIASNNIGPFGYKYLYGVKGVLLDRAISLPLNDNKINWVTLTGRDGDAIIGNGVTSDGIDLTTHYGLDYTILSLDGKLTNRIIQSANNPTMRLPFNDASIRALKKSIEIHLTEMQKQNAIHAFGTSYNRELAQLAEPGFINAKSYQEYAKECETAGLPHIKHGLYTGFSVTILPNYPLKAINFSVRIEY